MKSAVFIVNKKDISTDVMHRIYETTEMAINFRGSTVEITSLNPDKVERILYEFNVPFTRENTSLLLE